MIFPKRISSGRWEPGQVRNRPRPGRSVTPTPASDPPSTLAGAGSDAPGATVLPPTAVLAVANPDPHAHAKRSPLPRTGRGAGGEGRDASPVHNAYPGAAPAAPRMRKPARASSRQPSSEGLSRLSPGTSAPGDDGRDVASNRTHPAHKQNSLPESGEGVGQR